MQDLQMDNHYFEIGKRIGIFKQQPTWKAVSQNVHFW